MIALVVGNRGAGQRPHDSIDGIVVVAELLQRALHIRDDLIGRESVITIDRLIVGVIVIVGIVAPGWIPPTVPPSPPAEIQKDNRDAMTSPPATIVMRISEFAIVLSRLRRAVGFSLPVT